MEYNNCMIIFVLCARIITYLVLSQTQVNLEDLGAFLAAAQSLRSWFARILIDCRSCFVFVLPQGLLLRRRSERTSRGLKIE